MTLPVPYHKKLLFLCIDLGSRDSYLRKWFPVSERIYTGWSNLLTTAITKHQPDALLWFVEKVKDQAKTIRHIGGVRAAHPNLPILVVVKGIALQRLLLIEVCRTSLIDIEGLEPERIGQEMQMALAIAQKLVTSDNQ